MIKSGYFDKDSAMVSILERHKLKRRANCVSFVCNRGLYGHVKPAQKRYFSFNIDKLADEQSRRMLKRAKAESLRNAKVPEKIDRFIRKNCSLSFNPKYTDVKLEMNEEGKLEMRSNKRASKKIQKHRSRLTNKDMEQFAEEIYQEDVSDWTDDCVDENKGENEVTLVSNNDRDSDSEEEIEERIRVENNSDNLFNYLITQAEKARAVWNEVRPHKRSRKSSKPSERLEAQERSHIVYTEEFNPRRILQQTETNKVKVELEQEVELVPGKVILSDLETSPDQLREKFGQRYAEADCEPRRFTINVTDDVVNTLLASRSIQSSSIYASFLVFTLDGFYDNGLSCYKVLFNSILCSDTKRVAGSLPFQEMTMEGITNQIISTLLDLKCEDKLTINAISAYQQHSTETKDYLQEKLKLDVHTYFTSDQINNIQMKEKTDCCAELFKLFNQWEQVYFCEICYSDVTFSHYESSPGTKLNKCGHVFCDSCWRSHFRSKLSSGTVKVTCPGYECNSEVGLVTLLSLVYVRDLNLYLQRQCEADIEISTNTKWCPNTNCGRVISVKSSKGGDITPVDVNCACGMSLCFTCLGRPTGPPTASRRKSTHKYSPP
ncbi:hypothetical protein Btru_051787 [Bulinus truncatus]|nr:hypothetical protein Btru_051787 [Bulinus truncatus]